MNKGNSQSLPDINKVARDEPSNFKLQHNSTHLISSVRDSLKTHPIDSDIEYNSAATVKTREPSPPPPPPSTPDKRESQGVRINLPAQPPPAYYNQAQTPYFQTPYYQQQRVAGQPVYSTGPPPPPVDARAAPMYRPGAGSMPPPEFDDPELEQILQDIRFQDKNVRNRFIARVYIILTIQLLVTVAIIALAIFEYHIRNYLYGNFIVMVTFSMLYMVLFMALICYRALRRNFPMNFILLGALTLCLSCFMACLSCHFETYIVLTSFGITAGVTLAVSLIACFSPFDVTGCGMCLCVCSLVVGVFGIITIFVLLFTNARLVFLLYAGVSALLFCMYLMYDTQMVMGGRRIELSPEEYIAGALTLYVDIMYIFMDIMFLVGGIGRN